MIICSCRGITDQDLQDAFVRVQADRPDEDVSVEQTRSDLGDFQCGGCQRLFEAAARNFNETGSVKPRRQGGRAAIVQGVCDFAASQTYTASGAVPDLLSPAHQGQS